MYNQTHHCLLIYFEHQWPLVLSHTELLKTRTLVCGLVCSETRFLCSLGYPGAH